MTIYEKVMIVVLILACVAVVFGSIWRLRIVRDRVRNNKNIDEATREKSLRRTSPKRIIIITLIVLAAIAVTYLLGSLIYLLATHRI